MKIAFLGAANSIHIIKWVTAFKQRGHDVYLLTMHPSDKYSLSNIKKYELNIPPPWGYYLNCWETRSILKYIQPDLLNTHYASGYGTLSRLVFFKPTLLSIWGSDVYDFPYQSHLKQKILRKNLAAPNFLASTSENMKLQTKKFIMSNLHIEVTPFGVDMEMFSPQPDRDPKYITIGMVKRMAPKYGPEFLIKAFAIVNKNYTNLRLILVGGGTQEEELKSLAHSLGITEKCQFVGAVPHKDVPRWLNRFDIYCAPSVSESFGVAVVEASACGLPVIVSRVGGLPEVVQNNKTGIIIPPKDVAALARALETLITNEELRKSMGKSGREFVQQFYDWELCVDKMEQLYYQVVDGHKRKLFNKRRK